MTPAERDELAVRWLGLGRRVARRFLLRVGCPGYPYEDACAEAALGVLLAARDWDARKGPWPGHAAVYAWQHVRDGFRRWSRGRALLAPPDAVGGLLAPAPACCPLEAREAAGMLGRLPEQERRAVAGTVMEGLSQAEVAAEVGLSRQSVGVRLGTGLLALRGMLER